jgi:hypothetical protein
MRRLRFLVFSALVIALLLSAAYLVRPLVVPGPSLARLGGGFKASGPVVVAVAPRASAHPARSAHTLISHIAPAVGRHADRKNGRPAEQRLPTELDRTQAQIEPTTPATVPLESSTPISAPSHLAVTNDAQGSTPDSLSKPAEVASPAPVAVGHGESSTVPHATVSRAHKPTPTTVSTKPARPHPARPALGSNPATSHLSTPAPPSTSPSSTPQPAVPAVPPAPVVPAVTPGADDTPAPAIVPAPPSDAVTPPVTVAAPNAGPPAGSIATPTPPTGSTGGGTTAGPGNGTTGGAGATTTATGGPTGGSQPGGGTAAGTGGTGGGLTGGGSTGGGSTGGSGSSQGCTSSDHADGHDSDAGYPGDGRHHWSDQTHPHS